MIHVRPPPREQNHARQRNARVSHRVSRLNQVTHSSQSLIRDIPDFPKPGIGFKDITPVLADGPAFAGVVADMSGAYQAAGITHVAGIEARGFILATPIATSLGAGFVPIRKPGKLPAECVSIEYDLEYGTDTLEIHRDAVGPGDRVLLVDDVIATGGTAEAAIGLLSGLGAEVVALALYVELVFLGGAQRLSVPVSALVRYE